MRSGLLKWSLLLGLLIQCGHSYGQANMDLTFGYPQGEGVPPGKGTFALHVSKKYDLQTNDDEDLQNNEADFGGAREGYIRFNFSKLDIGTDYTLECELGFNRNYFSSSPRSTVIMNKGTSYLKKGKRKRGTDVYFMLNTSGDYTFRLRVGIVTKPNAPPVDFKTELYKVKVTGLIGPKKEVVKNEPKVNIQPTVVRVEPRVEKKVEVATNVERLEWEKAQQENTSQAYREFIRKYKDSPLAERARVKLTFEALQEPRSRTEFMVYFEHPKIAGQKIDPKRLNLKFSGKEGELANQPKVEQRGDSLFVSLVDMVETKITARDPQFGNLNETLILRPGATLNFSYKDVEGDAIRLTVKGGKPPYSLMFVGRPGGKIVRTPMPWLVKSRDTIMQKQELAVALKLLKGEYNINLSDGNKIRREGTVKVMISPPPLIPAWVWWLSGILLTSMLAIGLIIRRKKRMEEEELAMVLEQQMKYNEGEGKIKVVKKHLKHVTRAEASKPEANQEFEEKELGNEVSMDGFWEDSAVSHIFMKQDFIKEINEFVKEQFDKAVSPEESEDEIPEIGGFIMGSLAFSEGSEKYRVLLEKFVPITPEAHDRYHIVFGDEAWTELAEVQDAHPDLKMIGWFHTHPGHGLFLSLPDMAIQDGHFKEPYQIAMEMDTIEPNLDSAFFTRKTNGRMNNVEDLKDGADWYHWQFLEVEQF